MAYAETLLCAVAFMVGVERQLLTVLVVDLDLVLPLARAQLHLQ